MSDTRSKSSPLCAADKTADESHAASKSTPRWLLLFVFALGLRIGSIDESLWLDELHTAWVVRDGLPRISQRAEFGNVSPLWFLLPWMTQQLPVSPELALRLPSLLAGLATIWAGFWTVRLWTRCAWAGWFAACLLVVDRHAVFYSQEARPYAAIQCLSLLHLGCLWCALDRGSWRWRIATIGGWAVLFYIHYTSLVFIAAEISALLFFRRRLAATQRQGMIVDALIATVICLPALPHLQFVFARRANWSAFVDRPTWSDLLHLFPAWCYVGVPIIAMVGAAWAGRNRRADRPVARRCRIYVVPLYIYIFSIILCWYITRADIARLFTVRYLVAAGAMLPLFTATVLATRSWTNDWRDKYIAAALLVATIGCIVCEANYLQNLAHAGHILGSRRQGWRDAIAFAEAAVGGRDLPVFLRSGLIEADALQSSDDPLLVEYCLFPLLGPYGNEDLARRAIPLPRSDWDRLSPRNLALVDDRGEAWFLVNSSQFDSARLGSQIVAANWGESSAWQVTTARSFGDIHVIELRRQSNESFD